ncbi:uncharacterized protein CXorf38 isoform X1 [Xenopus laevis]|uniref:Uncharacterized protein n=2 Tax=Xenopus laevis TaxID=8355 RepID=A0A974DQ87_XENLA|nr:uncharacterized protein CXorf38 isoform X1 [Xenopus laevis]OCT94707.1 hypothetical protein XELAEV_18012394mg [Xenopus laevis]
MAHTGLLQRLNCQEYKNWMKAGQCLLLLKKSLQEFVASEMRVFHKQLSSRIPPPKAKCQCKAKRMQFNPRCPVCVEWKNHILDHHTNRNGDVHWGNCDPSMWSGHYWEVAKAYMPRGCTDKKEPQACDASALLNLLTTCDRFKGPDLSKVREVIKCRNELMHSSDMKVSSAWLKDFGNKIQNFVSEFRHVPGLKEEGSKIQAVLLSNWAILEQSMDTYDGVTLECDAAVSLSPICDLEMLMIDEMLQELYYQLEEVDTLSEKDLDSVQKMQNFISEHKDLQSFFEADIDKLALLLKKQTELKVGPNQE